jgi:hypothetical protein
MEMARQAQQAAMIQQGIETVGKVAGVAIEGWQKDVALQKANAGKIEAFGQMNAAMQQQGMTPIFPDEWLNKVASEKDRNKQAGNVAVLEFWGQNALQMQRNEALAGARMQQQAQVQQEQMQQAHGYRMRERAASAPAAKPMFGVRVGEGVNFGAGGR